MGQNVFEEIDENVKGANDGWNQREGFCPNGQTCTPGAPPASDGRLTLSSATGAANNQVCFIEITQL